PFGFTEGAYTTPPPAMYICELPCLCSKAAPTCVQLAPAFSVRQMPFVLESHCACVSHVVRVVAAASVCTKNGYSEAPMPSGTAIVVQCAPPSIDSEIPGYPWNPAMRCCPSPGSTSNA